MSSSQLAKVAKAKRHRDLTTPRVKVTIMPDGEKWYSIGSHITRDPIPGLDDRVPLDSDICGGQVTFYRPIPIRSFHESEFRHFGIGVSLYFRFIKWMTFLTLGMVAISALPALILACSAAIRAESSVWSSYGFEKTSIASFSIFQHLPQSYSNGGNSSFVFEHRSVKVIGGIELSRDSLVLVLSVIDALGVIVFMVGYWKLMRV